MGYPRPYNTMLMVSLDAFHNSPCVMALLNNNVRDGRLVVRLKFSARLPRKGILRCVCLAVTENKERVTKRLA